MAVPISRVMGIYAIRCTENDMIYVGKSEWMGSRWGTHLASLLADTHTNKPLQNDFNKYGFGAFSFSILELIDNADTLSDAEIRWFSKYDEDKMYNVKLPQITNNAPIREDDFIKFINAKWMMPSTVRGKGKNKYRIFKKDDIDEIVKIAIDYNVMSVPPRDVKFITVIKMLKRKYGYIIESGRCRYKCEKFSYKLILGRKQQTADTEHTIAEGT